MTDPLKDRAEDQPTEPEAAATAKPRKPRAKKSKGTEAALLADPETAPGGEASQAAAAEVAAAPKAKKTRAKKTKAAKEDAPEPEAIAADVQPQPEAVPELVAEQPEAEADSSADAAETESPEPPPRRQERLQKILAKAGVASRRNAEEMITQGRVQVNGQVVTVLGTKADPERDHIRVDGKLLHGAERHRYFVLNKPKGYVTTASDPEGRPTVMQFFEKMRERLYPVGRLDYQSEGLLLVTNDGELANKLTRAASGVEKTYLVKVAGQPSEEALEMLRSGVAIERDQPGSEKVRTAPARIRQVRAGDNPWFEVVLTEGRNRELRKMFEQVGHHVEKIRRVGYGPLILDQEPGKFRELEPGELEALHRAAEGKPAGTKAHKRRPILEAAPLPTVAPRRAAPTRGAFPPRRSKPFAAKPFAPRQAENRPDAGEARPNRFSGQKFSAEKFPPRKPFVPGRSARPNAGPAQSGFAGRPTAPGAARPDWKKPEWKKPATQKPEWQRPERPAAGRSYDAKPSTRPYGSKPAGARSYGERPPASRAGYGDKPAGRPYGDKPAAARSYGTKPTGKPYGNKPAGGRTYGAKPPANRSGYGNKPAAGRMPGTKPAWKQSAHPDRPPFTRPAAPPRQTNFTPRGPSGLHVEAIEPGEYQGEGRSESFRPRPDRFPSGRARDNRSASGRASTGRPQPREALPRPFTTSSGKPRAGGPRPSSKPGSFSKAKTGYQGKASGSGPRHTGSRPGGARPGGKPSGGRRPGSGPGKFRRG